VVGPEVLDQRVGDVEHSAWRAPEDDCEQPALVGQALADAQEERHAGPTPVLDRD